MVRVNLISPKALADQHLIAEYNELLMLVGYVKKYPKLEGIPDKYCLGPGHIKFFKNKLLYVKKRHETIKKEMRRRGFKTNKSIPLSTFSSKHKNNWKSTIEDKKIIKKRLIEKIKLKPKFYLYKGEKKPMSFFVKLIRGG